MISASTEVLTKINNGDVPFVRMQLTTQAGRVIWLEDGDFWANSISFSEATSQDGEFSIGSAVIGSFTFSLNNFDRSNRDLSTIDFKGAVVVPLVYFKGYESYPISKGIFYVTRHVTSGNIISCTAMDAMKLLDQSQTAITYPITVQNLVETICTANNIELDTETIPNGSFSLTQPSDSTGEALTLTDRQMLSYACQCIGCFAKMNEIGHMIVSWYDFDNPVQITSTFDGKSLWTLPIEITGIRIEIGNGSRALLAMSVDAYGNVIYMRTSNVTDTFVINDQGELVATADSGTTYTIVDEQLIRTGEEIAADTENSESVTVLYGTDDRIVKVENNPYVTASNVATICENISNNIFAKAFRPGTLPVLANPCLQAGDVLQVTDNVTGLVYLMPITSTTYNRSLTQNVICAMEDAEDSDLRPSSSYNMKVSVEQAIAQAQAADELAQAAQALAETGSYQPYIVSDKGTAFAEDTTATLTAIIYDKDMNEVDPDGTDVIYRWWVAKDSNSASYLDGGKEITVSVDDTLCDYAAGIYFETKDISEGVNPFLLCNRNGLLLTSRNGTPLAVRAAEVYE